MIISGSASQSLAASLAAELDDPLASVVYDRFPDGELLAAAPDIDGTERAVIVASTTSAEAHIELLQLQDAAVEAGIENVVTVIPYLGYGRQDAAYAPDGTEQSGYPVSARAVARAISTGTDRVLTVTPHETAVCEFFDVPADPIDAAAHLAEPLPAGLTDPVFLSPDAGAIDLAESVQAAYGHGIVDHFEKTRLSGSEIEIAPNDATVAGRDVVIVDDIIATGSTMSQSIAVLNDQDAARVFVGCVHPVLVNDARIKLARAGVEAIYGTDTIERAVSSVSVAPAIADAL
ncbi:MAG: ribose-phosphate diphosphokinase [Halobacteriales archaeon]